MHIHMHISMYINKYIYIYVYVCLYIHFFLFFSSPKDLFFNYIQGTKNTGRYEAISVKKMCQLLYQSLISFSSLAKSNFVEWDSKKYIYVYRYVCIYFFFCSNLTFLLRNSHVKTQVFFWARQQLSFFFNNQTKIQKKS